MLKSKLWGIMTVGCLTIALNAQAQDLPQSTGLTGPTAGMLSSRSLLDQSSAIITPSINALAKQSTDNKGGRVRVAIRFGGVGPNASGVLTGLDVTVPTLGLGAGWNGRLDLDDWHLDIFGRHGGTALTVCQVSSGQTVYYGLGIGYLRTVTSNDARSGIGGKLILGVNLGSFFGVEGNMHLGQGQTLFAGMARLRF
jgi:hypothetical protein